MSHPSSRRASLPEHRSRRSAPDRSPQGRGERFERSFRPRRRLHDAARAVQDALDSALDASLALPAPEPVSFAELGLPERLVTALARGGIAAPFAIQGRTLPDALAGRDVLGRAQTGSGKTLAFGLAALARLAERDDAAGRPTRQPHSPRALVLVPTRELAVQVADVLTPLASRVGLRVTTVYGGARYGRQIGALERGVDVVIATPGRLVDLIERGSCRLDQVEVTVVDEADYMADLGFLPVVTDLLGRTPAGGQRMMFSATLDRGVATLVERFLTDPAVHAVASSNAPVESMDHRVFTLDHNHKVSVATEVAARPGRTLFFVRTRYGADQLSDSFGRSGVQAAAIHGNLNQSQRQRALDAFAAGRTRVLVATDVAARGIHVDGIDLVVHFDPPNDHKDYVHRSGRTARAGASGTVLALVEPGQVRMVQRLHAAARVRPTVVAVHPGHAAVREVAESGEPVIVREVPARERGRVARGGPRAAERVGDRPGRGGPRRGDRSGRGAAPTGERSRRTPRRAS